jgi:5-histidylcysteine sulfoxide synthase/putative 4-mercaptohistidine N1-methyltranferase
MSLKIIKKKKREELMANLSDFYTMPVTLVGENVEEKREEIRKYFHKTYDLYEKLFDVFVDDTVFYKQPEPTRHPVLFYFGHTATFFINKLMNANIIHKRVNPEFEAMFAIGVDEMVWDDMQKSHYEWPSVNEVRLYREEVRNFIDELITTMELTLPIKWDDPFWIIMMGIEHERIHIETSSVLHRQLDIKDVKKIDEFWIFNVTDTLVENEMLAISEGYMKLGKDRNHHLYGWDNEYGKYEEFVESFNVSKYLVSNGEYMEFIKAGGYETLEYWDKEGREFLEASKRGHPLFWILQSDGSFKYRSMTSIIDMPLQWPVNVNCLEAQAFCRYKSSKEDKNYQLPTEAQWYLLYERCNIKDVPQLDDSRANINLKHAASACRVNRFGFKNSIDNVEIFDVIGNVWQWTSTHMAPFEGFKVHPAYDDFTAPTFDNRHNVMKGGSWISTGNEITKHSRYAFRRHFYQHSGFRYIEATNDDYKLEAILTDHDDNIYESDALISQYCEFQYGEKHFGVKNFAVACAQIASSFVKDSQSKRAFDIGCATGRASFELAREFKEVVGLDFSARFIQVGVALQKHGVIHYERAEEGELISKQHRTLQEFGLDAVQRKVSFIQGDACNLKPHLRDFDLIMATNLIDRLYEPRLFLDTVHQRLNSDGILVLTSPYTWLEDYTQKEHWLGGYVDSMENEITTLDGLKKVLSNAFELVEVLDVEFVIRETPRKYQHTIAQMSVWKKR